MVVYETISLYVETAKSLEAKIAKLDEVILMLYDTMIKAATNDNIEEYTLDNGQTKIHTKYKSTAQVEASINALERQKQLLINRLNRNTTGSIVRLVDSRNLPGRNNLGNGRG